MFAMQTWDEEASDETTLRFASEIAKKFLARVDPDNPGISTLNRGNFREFLDLPPPFTSGPEAYRNHVAAVGMLKKLPCLPLDTDPKLSALVKFLSGETECRKTNLIFGLWKRGEFQFRPAVESILHATQRKIQKIVGEVPNVNSVRFRFSPGGASTKTKKKDSDIRSLIAEIGYCSEELAGSTLLSEIMLTVPHILSFLMDGDVCCDSFSTTVHRSKLDFVRKDASTDRIITVEPPLNKFVQNGYGDYLRNCAKRHGIDLSDQSRNRELARIGSVTNGIATVDLSNASGLMALGLIEHLWPCEWFEVLMEIRSGYTSSNGFTFSMQAYAGMGNGTTFPVESITFFCLAEAVCEYYKIPGPVSAYGDDIIIPSAAYSMLESVFTDLGFQINSEKSFSDGPFRESCGSDWYSGYLVRPAFLRGNVSYRRLYLLHNHYYRLCDYEAAEWFLDLIPNEFRKFGPDGYGDGHLLGKWEGKVYYHKHTDYTLRNNCVCSRIGVAHGSECYKKSNSRERTSMYTFETYTDAHRTNWCPSRVDHILPIYSVYTSSTSVRVADDSYKELFGPIRTRDAQYDVSRRKITAPQYLRSIAMRFREETAPLADRYVRAYKPRKVKPRWFDLPPDSSTWVKGTPMPGTLDVVLVQVCVFDRPDVVR